MYLISKKVGLEWMLVNEFHNKNVTFKIIMCDGKICRIKWNP
jgi:hypothetical protein